MRLPIYSRNASIGELFIALNIISFVLIIYASLSTSIFKESHHGHSAVFSSSDSVVSKAVVKVTQNVVFSHPTIKPPSTHVVRLASDDHVGPASAEVAIEQMIENYSSGLVGEIKATSAAVASGPVILPTRCTWNLGSFMWDRFLKDMSIERVNVYNRPARGLVMSQDRLLELVRLVCLEGDSALPKLAL